MDMFSSTSTAPAPSSGFNNVMDDLFNPSSGNDSLFGGPSKQEVWHVAYEDDNLRVDMNLSKEDHQTHAIVAFFSNKGQGNLQMINMQVAVQKYLRLNIMPANGTDLTPLQQRGIKQDLKITNSEEGSKPVVMKLRLQYTVNGQSVTDTRVVNNLPAY